MKRVLSFLLVLILATFCAVSAQTTTATPASFDILRSGTPEALFSLYVPGGSLQWEDKTGDFVLGLKTGIGLDSIPAQGWTVEILKVVRDSSGGPTTPDFGAYQVQVRGWLLTDPSVMVSYLDTLDFQLAVNGFYFPDRDRETRTGLAMSNLLPRDSVFAFHHKTEGHAVGEKLSLRVDRYTVMRGYSDGRLKTSNTDHAHQKLHDGNHYFVWYDSTLSGANDSVKLALTTPAVMSGEVHLFFEADATAKTYLAVREGVTVTSGDTLTVFNSYRNSSNTSGVVVQKAVVITQANSGTQIKQATLNASGVGKAGGEARSDSEIILKPSTSYEFVLAATAASVVNIRLFFYMD
jgi:hypothetical protein